VRISVITIARDDAEGLRNTLASVRSQTYADIQHVVVDGGSADGSAELLGSLQECESLVWVSEPDHGRYDAMNKGVRMSDGQLLWFMHSSDTFMDVDSVEKVIANACQDGWSWAYGFSEVSRAGAVVGFQGRMPFRLRKFSLGGHPVPHQATIFEREFFLNLGSYDTGFGLAADQLLMLKAATITRPAVIPAFLCKFDGFGAGSLQPPWRHYQDMMRARQIVKYSPTSSIFADLILTAILAGFASVRHYVVSLAARIDVGR
jgi:glycosyltransferase involved in cell wall biosynthesis